MDYVIVAGIAGLVSFGYAVLAYRQRQRRRRAHAAVMKRLADWRDHDSIAPSAAA